MGFDGLLYRLELALIKSMAKLPELPMATPHHGGLRPGPARRANRSRHPRDGSRRPTVGCYGKEASNYTKRELSNRLIRLEIPRIGDSKTPTATLAYVYLDADKDGSYEHAFNATSSFWASPHNHLLPHFTAATSSDCAKPGTEWDCGVRAPTR